MADYWFVSYSRVDGGQFVLKLADRLEAGPPRYRVWVDERELQPGDDWDDQIVRALQGCRGVLFVMTDDSVRTGSVCKDEWVLALKYKKPVVPLRVGAGAELPFRLSSRQFVDLSGDFQAGLAGLRNYLSWLDEPAGGLAELRWRLSDAERELPRAGPDRQGRIEDDIVDLRRRIEKQRLVVEDPAGARQQAEKRIEAGMVHERQPERPVVAPSRAKFVPPADDRPRVFPEPPRGDRIGGQVRGGDRPALAGGGGQGRCGQDGHGVPAAQGLGGGPAAR